MFMVGVVRGRSTPAIKDEMRTARQQKILLFYHTNVCHPYLTFLFRGGDTMHRSRPSVVSRCLSRLSRRALPRRTPLDLIHLTSSKPTQSAVVRIFCVSNMASPAIHRSLPVRINTAKQKSKVEVADRCRWSVLQVCHFSVVRAQTILLCSWQPRQCSIHSLLLVHSILLSHSDIKN